MARAPRDKTADRAAITAATGRLLSGTPLHSATGKLTCTELITESGLRRDVVYEHRDLIDAFKAQVKAQHHVPTAMQAIITERDELARRLTGIKAELADEQTRTATLRRVAAELSLELHQAKEELAGSGTVTRLPSRRQSPATGPFS
jgi:hypothetical protein